ncbi:MAG: hypothetical protein K2O18_19485, partial [Oscillospiraceae bacterium]|nr:hypothetical protein [Oscillospiraceae bacterium]
MFDPKSDYALNKMDPEAIVYPSATGVHIRLTRENFASEEEFRFFSGKIFPMVTIRTPSVPDAATTITVF